jgi:sensor domain CHASE-containing protein
MNLRTKVFLSVAGVLSVLFIAVYSILSHVLSADFHDLERRSVEQNVGRVSDALDNEKANLEVKVADWGQWDDTYAFVQDKNQGYIDTNLQDVALELLHIQFVVITDKSGEILFKKEVDHFGKEVAFSPALEEYVKTHPALTEHADGQSVHSGLIALPEGVIVNVARAVTSSDGLSPVEGTIMFATFADDAMAEKIAALTHLKVVLKPHGNILPESDLTLAADALADDHSVFIGARSDRDLTVSGYAVKNDIDGKKALVVQVTLERTLYQRGRQSIILFERIMLVMSGIVILAVWYLFESLVLRRLFRLGRAVEEGERQHREKG